MHFIQYKINIKRVFNFLSFSEKVIDLCVRVHVCVYVCFSVCVCVGLCVQCVPLQHLNHSLGALERVQSVKRLPRKHDRMRLSYFKISSSTYTKRKKERKKENASQYTYIEIHGKLPQKAGN